MGLGANYNEFAEICYFQKILPVQLYFSLNCEKRCYNDYLTLKISKIRIGWVKSGSSINSVLGYRVVTSPSPTVNSI